MEKQNRPNDRAMYGLSKTPAIVEIGGAQGPLHSVCRPMCAFVRAEGSPKLAGPEVRRDYTLSRSRDYNLDVNMDAPIFAPNSASQDDSELASSINLEEIFEGPSPIFRR